MVKDTLGGFKRIEDYVDHKISRFERSEKNMRELYRLMFSEEENVLAEETDGYRIRETTYGQCRERAERRAAQLAVLLREVPHGSWVGLCMENSVEWIVLFWAILRAGYKPLLMNTRFSDEVLNEVVDLYQVPAVISQGRPFHGMTLEAADVAAAEPGEAPDPGLFQDEVLLMSSNTSGSLKLCGYTGERFYYQIMDSAAIIKRSRSIKKHYNGRLKLLAFLPFYHIFGLVTVYIWFGFFSRTLVFLRDMTPRTILNTVRKHQVTHIFAVPVFWEKVYRSALSAIQERGEETWAKFQKGMAAERKLQKFPALGRAFARRAFREVRENMFGESIAFLINGGGAIAPEVMSFVNGIGYHLVNGYGMTELGITSVELSEDPRDANLCAVGRPMRSVEYQIAPNGELRVRSRSAAYRVYAGGKDVTPPAGSWFDTHDLFALRDGRYYIEGRQDDLIICGNGENLNPELAERQLKTDGAERVCVAASPETPGKALVILQVSRLLERDELLALRDVVTVKIAQSGLEGSVDRLILTATPLLEEDDFKLNRKKIARRLASGALRAIDLEAPAGEMDEEERALAAQITEIFARALGRQPEEIGPDAHFFFDLGGSSLDYFTMVSQLQETYGVSFPATAQASAATVWEMTRCVRRRLEE